MLLLVLSFVLPFLSAVLLYPVFIDFLKRQALGQYIREDGPQGHLAKQGTPTGGGLLMLLLVTFTLVLMPLLQPVSAVNYWPWTGWFLLVLWLVGGLGLLDDWLKLMKKHNKGADGYTKLAVQALAGGLTAVALLQLVPESPVTGWGSWWVVPLSPLVYAGWCALVVTATSNAVNLTDGLDGLAASTGLVALAAVAVLLLAGLPVTLTPLWVAVLAWMGALAGFLVYNRHPALVFMGDSGSLALGASLAFFLLAVRAEWLLLLLGGVFVWEALSVVLQVVSFKRTGKRLFRMAPFHHHLELGGMPEQAIVSWLTVAQLGGAVAAIWLWLK